MALIDDLLNDIADADLRARLRAKIAALRKEKKFGLVFEHHHPEQLCLYDARIDRGARVARRNGRIGKTYIVGSMNRKCVTCRPEGGGEDVRFAPEDLTVVKRFGEPVFPTVIPVDRVSQGG